jgi:glycerophosphoryl diester phosphodiesterase
MCKLKTFSLVLLLLICHLGALAQAPRALVASHRGDWRDFADNSLEGIESCIAMGVHLVEIDVAQTKDGQLVLMHDSKVDRTTDGTGNVSGLTLAEIKNLYLRNGLNRVTEFKVPTLEEAMLAVKGKNILVNLDKADQYFNEVYAILQRTGTTAQAIIKSSQPYATLRNQYGAVLDQMTFSQVITIESSTTFASLEPLLNKLHPYYEICFEEENKELLLQIKARLQGTTSVIWINSLWNSLCAGYSDDRALKDPDGTWGYLIDVLGAGILQTDRPQRMLDYLNNPPAQHHDFAGSGTSGDPYIINDLASLTLLASKVNGGIGYAGQHFRLTADLDLGEADSWTPIGNGATGINAFRGYFHGGGHRIANMKVVGADDLGLFGAVSSATIDSIFLTNVNVSGTGARKGGLAGLALTGTVIAGCYVSGTISGAGNNGAIVGESYASVSRCYSDADVSGEATIGGLIGYHRNGASLTDSYSTGDVSGTNHVGGAVGYARNGGSIAYCYSGGNISGSETADVNGTGGILGTVRDAGWVIENNVAATPQINAIHPDRILGVSNGATGLVLRYNYAWSGVKVNGSVVSGGTADRKSGADKTGEELRSLALYSTASQWSKAAWSIAGAADNAKAWNIWEGKSLPYLQMQSAPAAAVVAQVSGALSYELRNPAAKVVLAKSDGTALAVDENVAAGSNTIAIAELTDGMEVAVTVHEAGKMPSHPVLLTYSSGSGSSTAAPLQAAEQSQLQAYPNPAANILLVTYSGKTIASAAIYNLAGALLRSYSVNATEAALNIADLAGGTYVLRVESSTVKFVKE